MTGIRLPIPIYSTVGDVEAFLVYPMVFNLLGEWIGWVTPKREVYSVYGDYVGWLSKDPRVLRKRTYNFDKPKLAPPQPPARIATGGSVPLPPMMAELTYDTIDVLQEQPELMPTLDSGEFREDMD
jgi:hypothetical protein